MLYELQLTNYTIAVCQLVNYRLFWVITLQENTCICTRVPNATSCNWCVLKNGYKSVKSKSQKYKTIFLIKVHKELYLFILGLDLSQSCNNSIKFNKNKIFPLQVLEVINITSQRYNLSGENAMAKYQLNEALSFIHE